MAEVRTYDDDGEFLEAPTPKNNDPEEYGERSAHSNDVHFNWRVKIQPHAGIGEVR